jgi:hypothetical protein
MATHRFGFDKDSPPELTERLTDIVCVCVSCQEAPPRCFPSRTARQMSPQTGATSAIFSLTTFDEPPGCMLTP